MMPPISSSNLKMRLLFCAILAVGLSIFSLLYIGDWLLSTESPSKSGGRRSLVGYDPIYPWARLHLRPIKSKPNPGRDTVLFWHIPKSGGSTPKSLYECFGQTLANRLGSDPRFGHSKDEEIRVFEPWHGMHYVNVDTTREKGILRAAEMGLVPSGKADIIFTGDPNFAIEHLFDDKHKGRVFVLFRHPIDRLVSKFYYLQTATWERTYDPRWKEYSVLEWAENHNVDQDHMVKKIVGKKLWEIATDTDLSIAMRIVRLRFVVGLMDKMEESVHRFNVVMGIDETTEKNKKCMDTFFGEKAFKRNANKHPKVEDGSPEWNLLAERNSFDMRLYKYVRELFEEQRSIIDSFANNQ